MEDLKNLVDEINKVNEGLKVDFDQALNGNKGRGNKAAAARARKGTLVLTKLFKEFRKESLSI